MVMREIAIVVATRWHLEGMRGACARALYRLVFDGIPSLTLPLTRI
jgi:hypothetical protein